MADLNQVFLMGRLTADPELRYIPSGQAVATLRLATSRKWTGKDGQEKKDTLYIDVSVWGRQAETCSEYLKKGSSLHVEGYLKTEQWEDKDGKKQSKIKVEADHVQFLDPKPKDDSAPRQQAAPAATKPAAKSTAKSRPAPVDNPADEDDDIPF